MLETLDQAAASAQQRYSAFLMSLRGLYQQASNSAPRDARALHAIRVEAAPLAAQFLDQEHDAYRNDLFDIQQKADAAAQMDLTGSATDVPWDTTGDEIADWYIHELGAQVWRDINTVVHARRLAGMSGKAVDPKFAFKDRLGRQYASEGHVRQTARAGLVQFGVATYAITADSLGATKLTVTHPEPDHKHNGLEIGYPIDAETLIQVFHPNSRAFLKGEIA